MKEVDHDLQVRMGLRWDWGWGLGDALFSRESGRLQRREAGAGSTQRRQRHAQCPPTRPACLPLPTIFLAVCQQRAARVLAAAGPRVAAGQPQQAAHRERGAWAGRGFGADPVAELCMRQHPSICGYWICGD